MVDLVVRCFSFIRLLLPNIGRPWYTIVVSPLFQSSVVSYRWLPLLSLPATCGAHLWGAREGDREWEEDIFRVCKGEGRERERETVIILEQTTISLGLFCQAVLFHWLCVWYTWITRFSSGCENVPFVLLAKSVKVYHDLLTESVWPISGDLCRQIKRFLAARGAQIVHLFRGLGGDSETTDTGTHTHGHKHANTDSPVLNVNHHLHPMSV